MLKTKNSPKKIIKKFLKQNEIRFIQNISGDTVDVGSRAPGCDSILMIGLRKRKDK